MAKFYSCRPDQNGGPRRVSTMAPLDRIFTDGEIYDLIGFDEELGAIKYSQTYIILAVGGDVLVANKHAQECRLPLNTRAQQLAGVPVYGDVLVMSHTEWCQYMAIDPQQALQRAREGLR